MSFVDSYRRDVQMCQNEITKLQRRKADLVKKAADLSRKANEARQRASRASSASSVQSHLRDAARHDNDRACVEKQIADKEQKIGREQEKLGNAQGRLTREEARGQQERTRTADRLAQEQERRMCQIGSTLSHHGMLHQDTITRVTKLESLPERITVLFLAANPIDLPPLRLDEEVRAIGERLRLAAYRDAVKLESRWAIRPEDVLQGINELNPTVVHFSAHGSDADEVIFQNHDGKAKVVPMEAIVQLMMATSGSIRLVFFNTCHSHNQAAAVVSHVEAAVGMKDAIGDDAARVFAAQFYSAIGFGKSAEQAFQQAKALVMAEGIPEENTPELFVREGLSGSDVILVNPKGGFENGFHSLS